MNNCPICSAVANELIYTNSRGNKYLENYVCKTCGFIYVLPRSSNETIEDLYLKGKFSIDARNISVPNLSKYKQTESWALERIHLLEENIPDFFLKKNNCLEVGCGTGSFLWFLKAKNQNVIGIEPDFNFSIAAQNRYGIDVKSILLEDFNSDKLFDFIASFHVIEHVLEPREFIKILNRKLKDNGLIYVECPTIDNIYTNDLNTFFWDVHINTFSNITLPYLIENEGFRILKVFENRGFISVLAQKENNIDRQFEVDSVDRIKQLIKNFMYSEQIENLQKQKIWFLVKKKIKRIISFLNK